MLRYYLTIGFTAWVGMATLAATSNDYHGAASSAASAGATFTGGSIPIAILGMIHHFLQSKLEVFEPTWMAGILALAAAVPGDALGLSAQWPSSRSG